MNPYTHLNNQCMDRASDLILQLSTWNACTAQRRKQETPSPSPRLVALVFNDKGSVKTAFPIPFIKNSYYTL